MNILQTLLVFMVFTIYDILVGDSHIGRCKVRPPYLYIGNCSSCLGGLVRPLASTLESETKPHDEHQRKTDY